MTRREGGSSVWGEHRASRREREGKRQREGTTLHSPRLARASDRLPLHCMMSTPCIGRRPGVASVRHDHGTPILHTASLPLFHPSTLPFHPSPLPLPFVRFSPPHRSHLELSAEVSSRSRTTNRQSSIQLTGKRLNERPANAARRIVVSRGSSVDMSQESVERSSVDTASPEC